MYFGSNFSLIYVRLKTNECLSLIIILFAFSILLGFPVDFGNKLPISKYFRLTSTIFKDVFSLLSHQFPISNIAFPVLSFIVVCVLA